MARPNIFLFLADDLNDGAYGFNHTGNIHVHTPNLDSFARDAVEFTGMHTPVAMCAPARAAMYTGLYPQKSGVWMNHGKVRNGTKSLPHYLQPLGYTTVLGGKTHILPVEAFPFEYYAGHNHGLYNWSQKSTLQEFLDQKRNGGRGRTMQSKPWCIIHCSYKPHGPHYPDGNYSFLTELPPTAVSCYGELAVVSFLQMARPAFPAATSTLVQQLFARAHARAPRPHARAHTALHPGDLSCSTEMCPGIYLSPLAWEKNAV